MVEESAKQAPENDQSTQDQFDSSLPPELRKLMEQTKQREEAAAAAELAANKENTTLGERSNTQGTADGAQLSKELTQASMKDKNNQKDDLASNGTKLCRRWRKVDIEKFDF